MATQDNLQSIMTGFDGTMAMIGKAVSIIPGKVGEVFAASFGVMNGTITGVISFEGSAQARADLEKAVVGVGAGYLADVIATAGIETLLAAALTDATVGGVVLTVEAAALIAAASPVLIVGAGAAAIIAGLYGDGIYDQYTAAQKAFFKWMIDHNIELPQSINDFFNAAQNWTPPRRDPLVLDLDGDGIETLGVNATTHVVFDYDGDGVKTGTGWIKGDDGFVVLDRNGNGTIDNGGELFGDQTLVNGAKASDGFAALSAEDTNANGKFDAGDTNFTNVRIWQDTNSDGISQSGELHTLNELGVTSINLTSTTSNNQNFKNTRSVA